VLLVYSLTIIKAADRTIILRITSKQIKDIIDEKYLPILINLEGIRPKDIKFMMNRLSSLVEKSPIPGILIPGHILQ
jgi:hypothetical protein